MSQSSAAESSSVTTAAGAASGAGEFMLFGFRVVADSMRKSVSLNNLSDYKQSIKEDAGAYVSADDAVPRSNGSRDRKRGIPWTEQEHKLFLLGLEKVGKGDWRGISKNFVKTRTPTQVASHAQKYYLRRTNLCRRRRRSSLFDITTESIAATPKKEEHGHCQEHISLQPQLETFKVEGVHVMTPYPVSPTPVMPIIAENPMERLTQGYTDSLHNSASNMVVRPQSILHTPESLIRPDLNLDLNLAIDQSELSLHLSLPSNRSAFQGMPSFINEESMISVV